MAKIITYVCLSLSIILGSIIGIEIVLRKIPNDYNVKAAYLKMNGDKIETLILGSSHSFYGINPNLIPNAYNLAHSSKSYDLDWKLLERYDKYLPNLQTIIIPTSYFSYVHTLGNSSQRKLLKNYKLYHGIDIGTNDLTLSTELFSQPIGENYIRFQNYINIPDKEVTIDEKGFIKKRRLFNSDLYHSEETVKKHTSKLDAIQIDSNTNGLNNILTYAQSHQIKVILVSTPVAPSYKENIDRKQYLHWQQMTKEIIKDYDEVYWIDLFNNDDEFNQNDFVDSDHLSLKGANKVTLKIRESLKK